MPYLLLGHEDSVHREHDLREVFNAVRYVAKTGCPWRWVPGDLPPWAAVYQQQPNLFALALSHTVSSITLALTISPKLLDSLRVGFKYFG